MRAPAQVLAGLSVVKTPTMPYRCPSCGAPRVTVEVLDDGTTRPVARAIEAPGRVYMQAISHEPTCTAVDGGEAA